MHHEQHQLLDPTYLGSPTPTRLAHRGCPSAGHPAVTTSVKRLVGCGFSLFLSFKVLSTFPSSHIAACFFICSAVLLPPSHLAADSEKVIELAPNIMDGYYHKGFALFNLKQYSEAVGR